MDEKVKIFYELYDRRRSVREFQDKPVEAEKLSRLLKVLNRAQSAANRQPWYFIVSDKPGRAELNSVFTKECFRDAPVVIVACADPAQAWVRKSDNHNYAWVGVHCDNRDDRGGYRRGDRHMLDCRHRRGTRKRDTRYPR